jgi:hypothetical protein
MLAQMIYDASVRASAPPKAAASKSCSVSSCLPKLILTELSAGLSTLPLELFGGICCHLAQNDLAQFAQICLFANDASERRLWKHLNLVEGEADLPAQWCRMGPRPSIYYGFTQRCYRELLFHLEDRPDLAGSVEKLTIAAHRNYSCMTASLLNMVGPTLRELEIRATCESRCMLSTPSLQPWLVDPDVAFKWVEPMPRVTKMKVAFPFEWAKLWTSLLAATPNLKQLHFAPLEGYTGGWDLDLDAEIEPIYAAYEETPPTPDLPSLTLLSIEQMSTELESAIIKLIKSSSAPTVKLIMGDPAGYYVERTQKFNKFLTEWMDSGRLELEIELPKADWEEKEAFWDEEREAEKAARAAEVASWPVPDVEEYKEEEMEPVTPQWSQVDGWPSDLGLGLWGPVSE